MAVGTGGTTPSQDTTKGKFIKRLIVWIRFFFAGIKLKTEAKQIVLLVNKLRIDKRFLDDWSSLDDMTIEIRTELINLLKCDADRVNLIVDACLKAGNKLYPEEAYDFFANWLNYRILNIGLDIHFYRVNSVLFKMASVALIELAKTKGIKLKEYEADLIISTAYALEREKNI